MARLNGRTAIVTGAASGIGKAIAMRFAVEGAKVAIFDIDTKGGHDTVYAIKEKGGIASFHRVDVTDSPTVDSAVAAVVTQLGRPAILVNNAAWDRYGQFLETDEAHWAKVIAVNLHGPLKLHHAVLPHMIDNGWGRIINVSSDAGRAGTSGQSIYSACKGGIIAFTKAIALETARFGITANVVCPGPTDTPLFDAIKAGSDRAKRIGDALVKAIPVKRVGVPEDYPGMIVQFAAEESSFITGQVLSINGGIIMHG